VAGAGCLIQTGLPFSTAKQLIEGGNMNMEAQIDAVRPNVPHVLNSL